MIQIQQQPHCICIHSDTAQSVKEAKYKVILEMSLIIKPSKIYAFQLYINWRNI